MSNLLPELRDFKPYQEALELEKWAQETLGKAGEAAAEAAEAVREADVGGAEYKALASLKETAAEAKRARDLAARDLEAAQETAQEQRKEAEAEIKALAKEQGKKIVNKIFKALGQLERGQKEYQALKRDLREKVSFEKPLSGENSGRYVGPDPAPVFSAYSWPVIGYKETAERYLHGWPEPEPKQHKKEAKLPGRIML